MKFVTSKQVNVPFIFCPDPVVIDKRKSWGESEDNFQKAPNGAFLKMKDSKTVSHLVQPNSTKTAPVGWVYSGRDNFYDKLPIFVGEKVNKGEAKKIKTLDGEISYEAKEDSWVVYNVKNIANPGDCGSYEPDLEDCWVQKESDLIKNYNFTL